MTDISEDKIKEIILEMEWMARWIDDEWGDDHLEKTYELMKYLKQKID